MTRENTRKMVINIAHYKLAVLSTAFLVCVVLSLVVNVFYGINVVYTHLFYIPIILTGIWYPRYAIIFAATLGFVHLACDYSALNTFKIGSFIRTIMFIVVAYVTSYLTLRRNRLLNELQMLNNAMLDMISQIDDKGVIKYVSPSVMMVLGYTPEQLTGKLFIDFIHNDDASTVKYNFQLALETQTSFRMDYRYLCADGRYIWIESLANPISNHHKGMTIYVFGSRDITVRKKAEENLKYLSIYDSLTGLHNRFLFEEELRRFSTGRFDPISVVMCDVDGLKLVNDNLGHDVGDRLLIAAANLLKEQFRTSDIVARIGGDEFAVLLQDCPPEMIEQICTRLKNTMMNKYISDTRIPLMMSVGYATRSQKERSIEELLKEADENMYKEKFQNRQAFRELFNNNFHRND